MNSKTNRLIVSLVLGLGLALWLLSVLGNPFKNPPIARAAQDNAPGYAAQPALVSVNQGQLVNLSHPIAENSITIDSSRKDWENVVPYPGDSLDDGGGAGGIDWITITLAHDCNDLFVRYKVTSEVPFTSNAIRYNVLIDVDQNRNTGYIGLAGEYPIGADVLLQGSSSFRFTGASQPSWSWSAINYYLADDQGLLDSKRDIEYKILISDLDVFGTGVTDFNWVAFADNPNGPYDYYPDGGNAGETGDFYTYTFNHTFTATSFPNPERGFYKATATHSDNYTPLDLATLQCYRENEAITLVHRMFYLEDFVNSDISESYITSMTQDFDTVRDAGLKMVVRFAYTDHYTPTIDDAPLEWIITHTKQLSSVLRANSDVIAVMQAGFIGSWGEWWYSDYFIPPDSDWDARRQVLFAVLDMLPATRMVQLRTPRYKMLIFDTTCAVSKSQAYNGTYFARTGHHNDCFLASPTDIGTYVYTPTEYIYLRDDTRYTVMGGETCNFNVAPDYVLSRLECDAAIKEMEQFHWSYLNLDWYEPVLRKWRDGGCFPEIERRLGYHFVLLQGTLDNQVKSGDDFQFSIAIENTGFAAPYNPRAVELILRHTSGLTHTFELPDDPRFWLPGEIHVISHTVSIPPGLPAGNYELLLNLPDPEPRLYQRPEYAIRLAQSDWEASTGYNKLNRTLELIPVIHFDSSNYNVIESAGAAIITVTLDLTPSASATVDYATYDGTATAGSDFTTVSGTLVFASNVTVLTFTVPITDDALQEPDETIELALFNPGTADIKATSATLTILNDDFYIYLPLVMRNWS